jgi:N-dimethylarginine dimethylaminohydrolase
MLMGATFLMSYPPSQWAIRGGENFRSRSRQSTNPRAAFKEWLTLCDAITRAGGRILVMPPGTAPASGADADATPLTGMMYTANSGALFKSGDDWCFVVSKMSVAHRQKEQGIIKAFFTEAGVKTVAAEHTWEGQADVCTLPGNRFVLTYGVRSEKASLELVQRLLPPSARVLDVQIRDPFFHGDTCLDPLVNRGGDAVLLAYGGALVDRTVSDLRAFLRNVEVLAIEEEDALGYACNALCVNGTVLVPAGLSAGLRGHLVRRGFTIEELDLSELFGKGGGGPRCLVNELRGFVLTTEAPDYVSKREELHRLADAYPEALSG